MSLTSTSLDPDEARRALALWDLPAPVTEVRPGSGTANASAIVRLGDELMLLKRRNPRYAVADWVAFDHALMTHLRAREVPVPVPIPARDGGTWARLDGGVYELFEFLPGDEHRPGDVGQVCAAGEMLARFHLASDDFDPPAEKAWARYHNPADIVAGMATIRDDAAAVSAEEAEALAVADRVAGELVTRLPDEVYWALATTIVHGDWHPANLKFDGGRVAGVFDLDWCTRQPRMVDLADGLLFFCSHRAEPIVPGDIWSLTQTMRMDAELTRAFGAGYTALLSPTGDELAALADLMRCRWLYCRVDAAARKVEADRRVEFLLRDLLTPLDWIDAHEADLADGDLL